MGSMFTIAPKADAELIGDLRSELRRTQAKLADESRRRAMAEADAARLRRNAMLRDEPTVPEGDLDRGYRCGACRTEVDYPFEQRYCCECGTRIDWLTDPLGEPDYDWRRDR